MHCTNMPLLGQGPPGRVISVRLKSEPFLVAINGRQCSDACMNDVIALVPHFISAGRLDGKTQLKT